MQDKIEYNMPSGTQAPAIRERHRSRRRKVLHLPRYTVGEEVFNGVSHGAGALFSVAGLILLVRRSTSVLAAASTAVFGVSMLLLYTVSCLYHSLPVGRAKKIFQVLDHCTIYLLIAGTYTPLCLLAMPAGKGAVLCAVAWAVAALGIVLNAISLRRFRVFSMVCYLALGWMIALFWKDIMLALTFPNLVLLVIGGVLYTVGAILFGLGRTMVYMHGVFHLFCLGGSLCHYLVVLSLLAR